MTSYLFLATGFEEIEALATTDVLRRGGMNVRTVSISDDRQVTGANGITAVADMLIKDVDMADAEWLICPGGMPGASNLAACKKLTEALVEQYRQGKNVAAICAAPAVVLAPLGILQGRSATCYPSFEKALEDGGATHLDQRVVVAGNVTTGNGPSSAIPFALAILAQSKGQETADQVAAGMLV